jgi:hypothetical protein
MNIRKPIRCNRCGKRLKKGGDNYRLDCTLYADFDGYIDTGAGKSDFEEILTEIEESGMSESELEEQVYFNLKQILCFDCRTQIIEFLKGNG